MLTTSLGHRRERHDQYHELWLSDRRRRAPALRSIPGRSSSKRGETSEVDFGLRRRDLSIWDVDAQNGKVESGIYTFYLVASSRHLRASTTLTV
jgi:hypothetical protein